METLKDRYSITELSKKLNVTDHALRYYEKEFKMCIPKDQRGRRFYTPEMANIMFQIKKMRDEGLEIKAIRKILQTKNIINDTQDENNDSVLLVPVSNDTNIRINNTNELKVFFEEFTQQIIDRVSREVCSVKEELTEEIHHSKLELGACVENSSRKLETKLEKHFQEVDSLLVKWREKNKKFGIKDIINRVLK